MTESDSRSFALFSKEKLKSAVDMVNRRRKNGLYLSLAAGAGLFLVLAAGVFLFFAPYRELMGEHGISYWPLMLLAPASIALIAFSVVYILTLRQAVREFRESLVSKMAEYIDPAIVHETGKSLAWEERAGALLGALGGEALQGTDLFRGRVPGAAVHFSDLRLKRESGLFHGLYFRAVMERKFAMPIMVFPSTVEISRSDLEAKLRAAGEAVGAGMLRLDDPAMGRQILVPSGGEEFVLNLLSSPAYARMEAFAKSAGAGLSLSCEGDGLRVAMLSPSPAEKKADAQGIFDEFDFALCRDFCRDARMCIDLARGMAEKKDVWAM